MPEGTGAAPAAPAATPSNFSAVVARNIAAAPANTNAAPAAPVAPAPASVTPVTSVTPAANGLSETAAAFNAQLEAQAANTNAQPEPTQQAGLTPEQLLQAELTGQQPNDPWAEQVHGLTVRDVVDAIKRGELPEELATQLRGIAKVNGQELPISFREALNGYQRLSDYTKGTMQLAEQVETLNKQKAALASLFQGWDNADGLAQGLDRMGLMQNARAAVTKNWGAPDKPNVQGFMDDMRRLGHWDTFQQAATHYADWWAQRYSRYGGMSDQGNYTAEQIPLVQARNAAARRMIAEDEAQQRSMWGERLNAETAASEAKRAAFKQQSEQSLRQEQTNGTQQQQSEQQLRQQVTSLKQSAFAAVGIALDRLSDPKKVETLETYFGQNISALARVAQMKGEVPPLEMLVAQAVQVTLEDLGADRAKYGPGTAPAAPVAGAATITPSASAPMRSLPARPQGAPVVTQSSVPRGGTVSDFQKRLDAIKGLPNR